MAIIATLRCSNIKRSVAFYTEILGFVCNRGSEELTDPGYLYLTRDGDGLILSSFPGDGEYGSVVVVTTDDVEGLVRALRARGLKSPGKPNSPVHDGPTVQSWGTREFYVDDPDGNTLRFTQY